jgi:antitoxin component of MazEF toxin-antitoxin module
MGYKTKIQKVDRPTNQSYYANIPTSVAQMMKIEKGEEFEWEIEDKNLLLFRRVNLRPKRKPKSERIKRSQH